MPYKISGTIEEDSRIIIINEDGWTIESNTQESAGSYDITTASGLKTVVARGSDGESLGFGGVISVEDIGSGDRGVFGGGRSVGVAQNLIEYVTISTTGNTADFGDLTVSRYALSATANGQRGIFNGGLAAVPINNIDYITITSTGDAADFGDLSDAGYDAASTSNTTNDRGLFAGGSGHGGYTNVIDYMTISSTGNAQDFGDLTVGRYRHSSCSNGTNNRGTFAGGILSGGSPIVNTIDYVTISSLGDATDFGDMTVARRFQSSNSNSSNNRGLQAGDWSTNPNLIDYITISSTGNAADFGDLTVDRSESAANSNGTSERGLFAGGRDTSPTTYHNSIDYVTISVTGNASDFGDLSLINYLLSALSDMG